MNSSDVKDQPMDLNDHSDLIIIAADPDAPGSDRRRAIMFLHDCHGYAVESLASTLGLAHGTVAEYLRKARREHRADQAEVAQRARAHQAALAAARPPILRPTPSRPQGPRAALSITAAGTALTAVPTATPLADLADVLVDLDDALDVMPASPARDQLLEYRHGIWQILSGLIDAPAALTVAGAA